MVELLVAVIGSVFGPMIGYWFKHHLEHLAWKKIQSKAIERLKDPNDTNDPRRAIAECLVEDYQKKIAQTSGQIRIIMNGDLPKTDDDVDREAAERSRKRKPTAPE